MGVIMVHEDRRRVVDMGTANVMRHSSLRRHSVDLGHLGRYRGHLRWHLVGDLGWGARCTFGLDVVDTSHMGRATS